jgi:2-keto-3-deoxy-galactonokinase
MAILAGRMMEARACYRFAAHLPTPACAYEIRAQAIALARPSA